MKKITFGIIVLLLAQVLEMFAVQPIVNIPELPRNLRNFVTDERKYFELLIDYFVRAKLLEAQLDTTNVVPQISYDAVANQDLTELRRLASLAKELYNKVLALPENRRVMNLQREVDKLVRENRLLKIENDSLKVESAYKGLVDLKDSLIKILTLRLIDCEYNREEELLLQLERTKYPPLLTFGINAIQLFFDRPNLTTYLAPSFDLSLRLLNFWDGQSGLNFTASYIYLTNVVEFDGRDFPIQHKFKDDLWNFYVTFDCNVSKALKTNAFFWQFSLGAGYFLGFSKEQQPFGLQNDYKGYTLNIYTILGGFSKRVPIGFVAGGTFFKYLDELSYDGLMIGKAFVPSFYLGLKFNLLNSF